MNFKKALINFAMIQSVVFATSVSVGVQIPLVDSSISAVLFIWMLFFGFSFLPSIAISILFAISR